MDYGFRKFSQRAEIAVLIGIAFSLPLWEVPKNLLWLVFPVLWLGNRIGRKNFGVRLGVWDFLVLLWIASGYLSAAFAGLHFDELRGAGDLAKYALLMWLVLRGGYSARELRWVLAALVASALVTLALAWWKYWTHDAVGRRPVLQLKSVGHVNHSAIYLAIIFGACMAWIFARWQSWSSALRAGAIAVAGFTFVSLVVMASRAAVVAGAALVLVLAAAWWPRWRAPMVASICMLLVAVVVAVGVGADLVVKHQANMARDDMLSARDRIWRMGIAAWDRYPWFGVGMGNYSRISLARVAEWRQLAGKPFDAQSYLGNAHAHNLYVNTLAERGLVGAAALAAVLIAWLAWLYRYRPKPNDDDLAWLLWGGAVSGLFVTVVVGMVNTTLHHEHGILATLLLGAWLSNLPRRAS